jgi:rubrerythrin
MLIFWPAPKSADPLGQGGYMLSQIPVDFAKVKKENRNQVILRAAIIAELDAINMYEQMSALTDDPEIKMVLLDIAREEKTHVGEFQTMLLRRDAEQVKELEDGKKEIVELTGK